MNIVIVGGGTAGWLAALMINKVHPNHKLTIIESSNIDIVGAGEGSTGLLTSILTNKDWDYGCDLLDFFKETGASIKYGINHVNWKTVGDSYFGPIGGSPSSNMIIDYMFAHYHNQQTNVTHKSCLQGIAAERKLSTFSKTTFKFDNIESALHFDARAVGKYFKKIVLKNPLVTHLDNEVVDIELNESGQINALILKAGGRLHGDFFIDASGFRKVLSNKLDVKWHSYKDNLIVNSAMPFLINYKENEIPELYTTAQAQKAGWMWQIPTMERKGCGYVFSDEFITPDLAQEEIELALGQKIDPIRILKFDAGRLENVWTKNCLSIGLSAAFAEPLEATSIHTTIIQLISFVFEYCQDTLEDTVNTNSINIYNKNMTRMYDMTKEFLVAHYTGGRTDSEFWSYISSGKTITPLVDDIIKSCNSLYPSNRILNPGFGEPDMGLWLHVLSGTGHLLPETSARILNKSKSKLGIDKEVKDIIHNYELDANHILSNNMSYEHFFKFIKG